MIKTHLWNFSPGRSSVCNTALYTERMTADPAKVTCVSCSSVRALTISKTQGN
jgi:hypothetical protein